MDERNSRNAVEYAIKEYFLCRKFNEECGYTPLTSFYSILSIVEWNGRDGLADTFNIVVDNCKGKYKEFTEFVMCLNWKIWEHHKSGDIILAMIYNDLWEKACRIVEDTFTKEELEYYYRVTD